MLRATTKKRNGDQDHPDHGRTNPAKPGSVSLSPGVGAFQMF